MYLQLPVARSIIMPGAKGQDWEKFKKTYADDEIEEKKITPLSAEYASYDLQSGKAYGA